MLEQRRAGVALLVRRAVQFARHLHRDAFGARLQVEDFRYQFLGIGERRHAHVDFGIGLFRNHVRPRAASDHADIDADAALQIVHRLQRLDDVAEFANGAAAVLRLRAGMRRHALDEHFEAGDALAPGDDLAAVACRLRHQHIFGLAPLGFDQRARGRAADLLIGDEEMGDAERRSRRRGCRSGETHDRQDRRRPSCRRCPDRRRDRRRS